MGRLCTGEASWVSRFALELGPDTAFSFYSFGNHQSTLQCMDSSPSTDLVLDYVLTITSDDLVQRLSNRPTNLSSISSARGTSESCDRRWIEFHGCHTSCPKASSTPSSLFRVN